MSTLQNSDRKFTNAPQEPEGSTYSSLKKYLKDELTFFRVHIFAFTFTPLIASVIFYECNGRFRISFIDSLFLCYSSMTVTGLTTVDLSTTTVWQQVILYVLMAIGDITFVSWIMVLVRKTYFQNHCEYVVQKNPSLLSRPASLISRSRTLIGNIISGPTNPRFFDMPVSPRGDAESNANGRSRSREPREKSSTTPPEATEAVSRNYHSTTTLIQDTRNTITSSPRTLSDIGLPAEDPTSQNFSFSEFRRPTAFQKKLSTIREGVTMKQRRALTVLVNKDNGASDPTPHTAHHGSSPTKYRGLGGFPGPVTLAHRLLKRTAPGLHNTLTRTFTTPYVQTYSGAPGVYEKPAKDDDAASDRSGIFATWLDFKGLIVGRNSDFQTDELTDEELENIGGVEYRALRILSYLVPAYFILTQVIAYILFAPWMSATHTYDGVFEAQPRVVKKPWFALFQVMGAYTGGGLSLVDQGMVPFQRAYLMIFALCFVILAGNHALPIFLRLVIWTLSKLVNKTSDEYKALIFLLDHPRRCFVYLFPSHQTWFLVLCLILFSIVEWISFEVLGIYLSYLGLPAYESITTGPRIVAGLFQGLAARASGFAIVPIANLAPALQFLYVVMMYIAVYPVALSIRSTNVYEEKSLGVFELPPDDEDEEPTGLESLGPRQRIGRYVDWHLHRQLSIDIWWLVWGVFLVSIIERGNLLNEDLKWFDLFRVLFELVSAFGGIGLSLGVPFDNFSFSGAFKPLSKLVMIVIMVRGRHRGLPMAIDRAIELPSELVQTGSASGDGKQVTPPVDSAAPTTIPTDGHEGSRNSLAEPVASNV